MNPTSNENCRTVPASWPLLLILLVALGFAAYSNAIFLPFVHDDIVFIRNNPDIGHFRNLAPVFVPPLQTAHEITNRYYRPLLEVFYRIEYQLFGFNPAGYHLLNICLHLANSVLVFFVLGRLLAGVGLAWIVAALFLLHPVQTEAVVCVSGVSNLLSVFFVLGSLLLFLRYARRHNGFFLVTAGMLYGLALLTKESAIVLAGLLFLVAGMRSFRQDSTEKSGSLPQKPSMILGLLVFIGITAGYLLWCSMVLGRSLAPIFENQTEFFLRIAAIPRTLVMDAGLLVFPYDLHYYRSIDILQPLGMYPLLAAIMILAGIGLVSSLAATPRRLATLGAGWFLVAILPVLNLIPLVNEYSLIAAFEHFLYFPSIGFFILVCVLGNEALERIAKARALPVKIIVLSAVLAGCLGLTMAQNRVWRSEIALFERTVKFEKNFGRGELLLAKAYYFHGDDDLAIAAFTRARAIMQNYYLQTKGHPAQKVYRDFLKEILTGLAHSYEQKGDFESATHYYLEALGLVGRDSDLYNSVGICYVQRRLGDKATRYFQESLSVNPHNVLAMNNLALCYIQAGRKEAAKKLLQNAVSLDKNFINARKNLETLQQAAP